MRVTNFDKPSARAVQDRALAALRAVAADLGLTVRAHGGSIDGVRATLKFEFVVDDEAALEARAREDFEHYCVGYGLTPAHFGATFTNRGAEWAICGVEPGRPKFCIRARRVGDGKVMLFPRETGRRARLPGAPAAAAASPLPAGPPLSLT